MTKKEVILGHEGTSKPVHCACNEQSITDCETEHVKGMGEWKEKVESCNNQQAGRHSKVTRNTTEFSETWIRKSQ